MTIEIASKDDLGQLVPLFDAYRVFYEQKSDISSAHSFLEARFENDENLVFIAFIDNQPIGFTQLYFTFSSVSLQPFLILNDLFVLPKYRRQGIGAALLQRAKVYCSENQYKGLALETATNNPAQKLYENLGWKKDSDFLHYFWTP